MTVFIRLLERRRRQLSGDEGLGMVLVIGISIFVFTLAVTATTYAVNGVRQSGHRTTFEQSLATAENGIDYAMAQLQHAFSKYNSDFPIPNDTPTLADPSPSCDAARVSWPATIGGVPVSDDEGTFLAAGGRTAEANERLWARQQLTALESVSGCVQDGGVGQYVVLKPVTTLVDGLYPKFGKVYALGAVPGFSDTKASTRLLKSEYVFMPYRPTNAVLTGADLDFQGEFTITGAAGVDPSVASVHANGTIDVNGASGTVSGTVTSTEPSGASLGGQPVTTSDAQQIPSISATDFYFQAPTADPTAMTTWTDLCPDGTARPYSSTGPCTNSTVYGTNSYNNWTWSNSTKTWTANRDVVPGTYFVDQANAANGSGNASLSQMTVIASSQDPDSCTDKHYGNIDWDHYDVNAPALHNLFFYADGDVQVTANIHIGQGATTPPVVSGMIVSGDQTYLYTQSNSAVGSVVAGDTCTNPQPSDSIVDTNLVHSDLYYDPNSDAPFTSVITNTLWLDYSSSE